MYASSALIVANLTTVRWLCDWDALPIGYEKHGLALRALNLLCQSVSCAVVDFCITIKEISIKEKVVGITLEAVVLSGVHYKAVLYCWILPCGASAVIEIEICCAFYALDCVVSLSVLVLGAVGNRRCYRTALLIYVKKMC